MECSSHCNRKAITVGKNIQRYRIKQPLQPQWNYYLRMQIIKNANKYKFDAVINLKNSFEFQRELPAKSRRKFYWR